MCEKACPNGTIKIASEMVTNPETGKKKKKKQLLDYEYDLGVLYVLRVVCKCLQL